jgi:hypothetical protein
MRSARAALALPAVLLWTACAAGPRPAAVGAPGAGPAAGEDEALSRSLTRAWRQGRWKELRIDAECRQDGAMRSVTFFGSGVGVWDGRRQFTVSAEALRGLLEAFRRQGFPAMPAQYGGRGDPAADPSTGGEGTPGAARLAVELICRVGLRLDGAEKQVFQLAGGRQSAALAALAGEILAVAEEAGRDGEGAASLAEALDKVAEGRLAPEILALQIVEEGEGPEEEAGWMLTLEAGRATAQRHGRQNGLGEPRRLALPAEEVAGLARLLAEEGLADLPGNLWAARYTDLAVEVLDHRRTLQARQFAGMTPATHGVAQERFERIAQALSRLARQVLAEGRPAGKAR